MLLIEPLTCRSRSNAPARRDDGMVLVIVMMVAALVLVGLTMVLPSVYQEGQREREEETVFRGMQYGRAVALFHRQFNRYPVSVRELIETNKMRFLRKEYTDPLDPKGKWRFIHANAAGVLIDSKNQPVGGGMGQPANMGSGMGQSSLGTGFGQSSSQGLGMGGGTGQQGSASSGQGVQTTSLQFSAFSLSSSESGGQMQGAFIVGVAPTSHHESIRVLFKKHHYDEWEFLGIDMGLFGIQVGLPGGPGGQQGLGVQTTPQTQGFSLGNSSSSSSGFGTPTN